MPTRTASRFPGSGHSEMSTALSLSSPPTAELPPLIGVSPAMQLARSRIEKFARGSLPVLLVGPTGTGKELLAQHMHARSGRLGSLVDVNCGALPREMTESLLFGHRKGAFTGAIESTIGLIMRADRGTLFLDELTSLPPEGQAKLLRVLETGEILPLGDSTKRRSDFRLVSAVQEDIDARVCSGQFRRDLFHRVTGLRVSLPALADRREDIPLLAEYFAQTHRCTLAPEVVSLLRAQPWPGNVRELRACVGLAAVLADDAVVDLQTMKECLCMGDALPAQTPSSADLLTLCRAHGGHAGAIAAALGISRATLFRRLRGCGISLTSLRISGRREPR
jgi:DNA-binding NtrC family response regulator